MPNMVRNSCEKRKNKKQKKTKIALRCVLITLRPSYMMQTLNRVNNSERKASKMQPAQSAGKRMWQDPVGPSLLVLVE